MDEELLPALKAKLILYRTSMATDFIDFRLQIAD